jgi:hypothetical protein
MPFINNKTKSPNMSQVICFIKKAECSSAPRGRVALYIVIIPISDISTATESVTQSKFLINLRSIFIISSDVHNDAAVYFM